MSLLVVILLLALFRVHLLMALGQFLVVKEVSPRVDLIHPLGWTGTARIDHAIRMYKEGHGDRLYLTGNTDNLQFSVQSYSELAYKYLSKFDIPRSAVFMGPSTSSTYEEVVGLRRLLFRHPDLGSVMAVSSPYHMRRIKLTLENVLPERVEKAYVPVPWEDSRFSRRWWAHEASAAMVITEYIKLAYYYFNYFL